jgi:protein-disulfide isomerase
VRIVWKHNPLPFHQYAMPAALAAMAAEEQGKFWEYNQKLFENQQKLTPDDLTRYAKDLGLDVGRFKAAMTSAKGKPTIDADAAEAKSLGATGTPAFFVNGRYMSGARPFDDFAKAIDAELTRLKIPIPPGAHAPQPAAPAGKAGH